MENSTNLKGGGVRAYAAPDLAQTVIAVESGFAGSTTNEAFYESRRKTTSGAERSTSSNNGQTTGDHEKDAKNSDARCSSCNGISRMFEGGRIR